MIVQALIDCGISCKYEELSELDHFDMVDNFQQENYKLSVVSNHLPRLTTVSSIEVPGNL